MSKKTQSAALAAPTASASTSAPAPQSSVMGIRKAMSLGDATKLADEYYNGYGALTAFGRNLVNQSITPEDGYLAFCKDRDEAKRLHAYQSLDQVVRRMTDKTKTPGYVGEELRVTMDHEKMLLSCVPVVKRGAQTVDPAKEKAKADKAAAELIKSEAGQQALREAAANVKGLEHIQTTAPSGSAAVVAVSGKSSKQVTAAAKAAGIKGSDVLADVMNYMEALAKLATPTELVTYGKAIEAKCKELGFIKVLN